MIWVNAKDSPALKRLMVHCGNWNIIQSNNEFASLSQLKNAMEKIIVEDHGNIMLYLSQLKESRAALACLYRTSGPFQHATTHVWERFI